MRTGALLLCALLIGPAYAGKPKCGPDSPPPAPPNPTTPTVKKHDRNNGLSFAEGAVIVIGIGIACNLAEGCKAKFNPAP